MLRRPLAWSLGLFAAGALAMLVIHTSRSLVAQSSPAGRVIGGPYVVNGGPRAATVAWVVETSRASLGTSPDKLDKSAPVLRAERTTFSGLQPGTTYYYQAFPGEAGRGSFKTPPAGAARFEFVVYGDTRTRHDVHRTVIDGILKFSNPDFVVHTGDLVADGNDDALWPVFFDIERELLRRSAFYPVLGNHERNARNYYDFMSARPYYSFDWGSAHFSVIDSDIENVAAVQSARDAFWRKQIDWLQGDLERAQKADFRFLVAHHPPITAVKNRQGGNSHMTALEPMLERHKLTAGFFGHDHNYQHYLKNGVHYFTSGGGGAPLYDVDVPPADITKKVERTENFLVVKVDGQKALLESRKPNGELLDTAGLGR